MQNNNNENFEKKPDLGSNNLDNKENIDTDPLKESFSNLKNELNKLQNKIKEGQEDKKDEQKLDKLDEEIKNIDSQIDAEREIEKNKKDGNLSPRQEQFLAQHMQKITVWLKQNPGEANQGRANSATSLLKDIYSSDPNPIANSMQKIIRFILSLTK